MSRFEIPRCYRYGQQKAIIYNNTVFLKEDIHNTFKYPYTVMERFDAIVAATFMFFLPARQISTYGGRIDGPFI